LAPPERNPYNDPDYSLFIVTDGISGKVGKESGDGGLLGMLRAMMQQGQAQSGADSVSVPNNRPEYNSNSDGSLQGGLVGRLLALQDAQARNARDQ
jgi:hypothetical protein